MMGQLIQEGKILHWGLSIVTEDIIRRAHAVCPVTAIQNIYSMLERDTENLFPVLEELNIGLVTHCPLAKGFLTAAYDKMRCSRREIGGDGWNSLQRTASAGIRRCWI